MSTKKYRLIWVRIIVFLVLTVLMLGILTRIFIPKYFYNDTWSMTTTYSGFYDMEENTVDVLFLGSSRTMSSFVPQQLYNEYGITSYNLGSTQQSMLVTYFWLKEALRFQTPKAVVIEVKELFPYREGVILNADEASIRKALDYMKWSSVKKEAVDEICALDETQEKLSYYFPMLRFHSRWKSVGEDDFAYSTLSQNAELKGYNIISKRYEGKFTPIEVGTTDEKEEMLGLMCDYMDRIVQVCDENDIRLILVNTPYKDGTVEKYNSVSAYAAERQIPYYDLNVKEHYEALGYDFGEDNADKRHSNVWGATKITGYIGKLLSEEYGIAGREDAQWEETAEAYELSKKDCELTKITDIYEYTSWLQDERYSVFIAVKGEGSEALNNEILGGFRQLGIAMPLEGAFEMSYYAVADGENIREEVSWESLSVSGSLRDGIVPYSVTSEGKACGNSCSIKIDGDKYAVNGKGLNIVVYNNEIRKVIDSVCFNMSSQEHTATR